MSEISFSGQWDERTSTALVAFHYVARRTNTDDRLEGSSVGLFQARCLSGRGKSRTRGILGGALCCADTKTRGPPPSILLEAGKVAEILGPSIAIESTAGTSRFPSS